ncbi:hypothetical protein G7Y89_g7640 [Cudoniella acicularis]|uniref:Uncharacterized protein n=1 Tax=Cudoniella acicularis TaxID=354080 RepID=A0A8H4W3L6_9HELO|nr:hypothetical protein G7Y89_g7640 [Cudoniella acicularis]
MDADTIFIDSEDASDGGLGPLMASFEVCCDSCSWRLGWSLLDRPHANPNCRSNNRRPHRIAVAQSTWNRPGWNSAAKWCYESIDFLCEFHPREFLLVVGDVSIIGERDIILAEPRGSPRELLSPAFFNGFSGGQCSHHPHESWADVAACIERAFRQMKEQHETERARASEGENGATNEKLEAIGLEDLSWFEIPKVRYVEAMSEKERGDWLE